MEMLIREKTARTYVPTQFLYFLESRRIGLPEKCQAFLHSETKDRILNLFLVEILVPAHLIFS